MNKYFLVVVKFFLAILPVFSQPLPVEKQLRLVIDTDAGLDDFRTLSLLFSLPELNIQALTVSHGNLPPDNGFQRVMSLLSKAGMEYIPVGKGKEMGFSPPAWQSFNESVRWTRSDHTFASGKTALQVMEEVSRDFSQGVTMLCLGPLTNLSAFLDKYPERKGFIERVIWYNSDIESGSGFNFSTDSISARNVLSSGIRMDIVSNLSREDVLFDLSFISSEPYITKASGLINAFYQENHHILNLKSPHLRLMDELVAVYLLRPEIFDMESLPGRRNIRHVRDYSSFSAREVVRDILMGNYSFESHIVLNTFPGFLSDYQYDVREIMQDAISRHGREEWRAAVITNEFHRHLGIYSIVGAKMGVYALELLQAEKDFIRVKSYAGHIPPHSCLNDGIQVSTGSTLGMGTITVSDEPEMKVAADFSHGGKTIRLSLKPEYLSRIESDISEGIVKYGLADDGYWKLIRRAALKYWLEWSRGEIFDVEEVR